MAKTTTDQLPLGGNLNTDEAREVMDPILGKVGLQIDPVGPGLNVIPINDDVDINGDAFDWSVKNGDVILPEQRELAVYTNTMGQAVIRIRANYPDDQSDPFICISHAELPKVIGRLQEIAAAPLMRDPPADRR